MKAFLQALRTGRDKHVEMNLIELETYTHHVISMLERSLNELWCFPSIGYTLKARKSDVTRVFHRNLPPTLKQVRLDIVDTNQKVSPHIRLIKGTQPLVQGSPQCSCCEPAQEWVLQE